jgi:glycosyltransferase involved in cell wall biosynthesis
MSNILYIGPYREFSGMGNAARRYIQALHRSGHNVSIRPIYNTFKTYPESEIETEILDLEHNRSDSYHVCVQHCYPHQFHYNAKAGKIIGVVHLESYNYRDDMAQYLRLPDEILVGSRSCKNAVIGCGIIDKPIHVIPEPIDLKLVSSFLELNPTKKDGFTFYVLADFCQRKNILTTITAHSILCSKYDYANLIIKTKHKNLAEFSVPDSYIKESVDENNTIFPLHKDNKRQPRIIIGDTDYKNILHLHNKGDCFIGVSSGESFGYATLEAMAFQNNIIVNENTGTEDLIGDGFGLTVSSVSVPCEDPYKQYFLYNTIFQTWQKPKIEDLVRHMETAILESDTERKTRQQKQKTRVNNCSMESVAEMLRGL